MKNLKDRSNPDLVWFLGALFVGCFLGVLSYFVFKTLCFQEAITTEILLLLLFLFYIITCVFNILITFSELPKGCTFKEYKDLVHKGEVCNPGALIFPVISQLVFLVTISIYIANTKWFTKLCNKICTKLH